MSTTLSVGQLATAFLFGTAGFSHVRNPVPLSQAMPGFGEHNRRPIPTVVVILWGVVEVTLAVAVFSAVLSPDGPAAFPARVTAVAVSAGYLAFLLYSVGAGHPWCACTSHRSRVNSATLARPLLMGALCVGSADVALSVNGGAEITGIVLAGAALAILGWSLPEAIAVDHARGAAGKVT